MPLYRVTEVATGGGSGCLGLLVLLGIGALVVSALEDSGTPRRKTQRTTSSEEKRSPAPSPSREQPERTLRSLSMLYRPEVEPGMTGAEVVAALR